MKKLTAVVLFTTILLAGCSDNKAADSSDPEQEGSRYPVTIENFAKAEGATNWTSQEQTFDEAPQKVLANTRPAAELLLHLGLKDNIAGVGATFGEPDAAVADEFAELNLLGEEYISKETALSVDPDLVYGRGGLFDEAEWGVGTVASLNEMGINTYVLETSTDKGTFDSVYNDIDHLGEIFNVQEQAEAFKGELKDRQKKLTEKLADIQETKTFAYIHSNDPDNIYVYSLAADTFSLSIFEMVKLEQLYPDTVGDVSLETMIESNPDVLIVPQFDGYDDENSAVSQFVEALYENEKLASITAIKNKDVYIMDYNHMFGYSYLALDGVELLAQQMYPELFK